VTQDRGRCIPCESCDFTRSNCLFTQNQEIW